MMASDKPRILKKTSVQILESIENTFIRDMGWFYHVMIARLNCNKLIFNIEFF